MKYFKIIAVVWLVFFAEASFASETTETEIGRPVGLIFYMLIILVCTLTSSLTGKATLSPKNRVASVSIFIGVIAGGFVGVIAGEIAGVIAGVIAGGIAGVIAGGIAGVIAGWFAGKYGLNAHITKEWIFFCLLMILLEYLIVFVRIKYQAYQQRKASLKS